MEDIQTIADERQAGVGTDIRDLRKSRNVTLADLADRLDRSIGWLSQVERGQTEPAIPDLRKIARIFEIPISFFFRNEMADEGETGLIVRAHSRAKLGSRQDGLVEELLSPNLSGDFEMIRSEFEPHSKITLWIGDKAHHLTAGDSFQFQNEHYRWENSSDEPAIALWVISPPVY